MLHVVSEHVEAEKKKSEESKEGEEVKEETNTNHHQSAAVLAIALIAFGEDVGTDMCKRSMAYMI